VSRSIILVPLAVAALSLASDAGAAVRVCMPAVSSGLQEADTEQHARALAISAWITAAAAHGQAYASWRLATGKLYNCTRTATGAFRCLAKAEPCAISQVPPPPGALPPRREPGIGG
jgi:hypothetical protein